MKNKKFFVFFIIATLLWVASTTILIVNIFNVNMILMRIGIAISVVAAILNTIAYFFKTKKE